MEHENGKCPNCGLLYEVNRVKDYYASKQQQAAAAAAAAKATSQGALQIQSHGQNPRHTRYVSPQPQLTSVSSLAQPANAPSMGGKQIQA